MIKHCDHKQLREEGVILEFVVHHSLGEKPKGRDYGRGLLTG